ncbi:hypothetical protein PputGB1_2466 [Pseudomonas putida GB-1]|uniref:Exotoxin A catalytic domain-containing protein n=2 Tax=Pseudomonas TaxID=286 RepID=B0KQV0_PSEPG|nr:hypothetical protein PputGB1_2466 [Pseudomonas putida GB-1]
MTPTLGTLFDTSRSRPMSGAFPYSPYGFVPRSTSLLGFNGERLDPCTCSYLLGSGYRLFNPALMRFGSPDSVSPFGYGGLNSYGYCQGDPINLKDPSGHGPVPPGYDFVGYHGSTLKHQSSLLSGVQLKSRPTVHHGKGFYFTQDRKLAWHYARRTSSRERNGSTPHVFGVYVKKFKELKAGAEVVNLWRGTDRRVKESYRIRESVFNKVKVLETTYGHLVRRNSFVKNPGSHSQRYQGSQGSQGFQSFQTFQGYQSFQGNQSFQSFQGFQGFQNMQDIRGNQNFRGFHNFQYPQ